MKNLLAENCLTPSKRDRVFSVAAHLCLVAIAKPLVLLETNNLFQGSQHCLRRANNLRQKRKKLLKNTVPVLSVLHSIAANHNSGKQGSSGEKIVS